MVIIDSFVKNSAVWGCALTLAAFGLGTLINHRTGKSWCNPLLLASIFVILVLSMLKIPYSEYKSSSSLISYLLFPATVCLAVSLYEKLSVLKKNAISILFGIVSGVITSLGSVTLMAIILQLNHEQYVTLLPKSITTAIGMDITSELGGIPALASVVIILTGIVGNLFAETLCKLFHIEDKIARGVAIGSCSHAIGTAKALEMGEVEGAMSGLAIAVAGILTAMLSPIFARFI